MRSFDPARLRSLRQAQRITAAELARRLGISPAQIHRLERGQRRLTVDGMLGYCAALGIEPGSLFETSRVVSVTGAINSEFQIEPLAPGTSDSTVAPTLSPDMSQVAALRWAASGRFQPMRDHVVFYQRLDSAAPSTGKGLESAPVSWNSRSLVTRGDGGQCLGWPIQDGNHAHIDFGNGPVEFNVEIVRADPVIAVMPPAAIERLQAQLTQTVATAPATGS